MATATRIAPTSNSPPPSQPLSRALPPLLGQGQAGPHAPGRHRCWARGRLGLMHRVTGSHPRVLLLLDNLNRFRSYLPLFFFHVGPNGLGRGMADIGNAPPQRTTSSVAGGRGVFSEFAGTAAVMPTGCCHGLKWRQRRWGDVPQAGRRSRRRQGGGRG
jgi:hypothetical protein